MAAIRVCSRPYPHCRPRTGGETRFRRIQRLLGGTLGNSRNETATRGPAASNDPSRPRRHDLHELERRIAALEERLAELTLAAKRVET